MKKEGKDDKSWGWDAMLLWLRKRRSQASSSPSPSPSHPLSPSPPPPPSPRRLKKAEPVKRHKANIWPERDSIETERQSSYLSETSSMSISSSTARRRRQTDRVHPWKEPQEGAWPWDKVEAFIDKTTRDFTVDGDISFPFPIGGEYEEWLEEFRAMGTYEAGGNHDMYKHATTLSPAVRAKYF